MLLAHDDDMKRRVRVTAIQLLVSLSVALAAAALIFFVWYPSPLDQVAGGLKLFGVLVAVDVVLGPLLAAVVASPGKPTSELRRDIAVIATLQLAAFSYGMYTIAQARPVLLVLEADRLQVVSAADLDGVALERAEPSFRRLSWTGPRLAAVRRSHDIAETMRSIDQAIEGVALSQQPERWVDYGSQKDFALKQAHPVSELLKANSDLESSVARFARESGVASNELRYMPVSGRRGNATAVIAPPDARIVGYLPMP